MNSFRLTLAAALLAGATLPALAIDTKPVINGNATTAEQAAKPAPSTAMQNNAQAGTNDMGRNAAPNMRAQSSSNTRTAMNTSSGDMGFSNEASPTQRKGTHLSKAQERRANAAEAQTTKELNQQAAAMAAPNRTAM